MEKINQSAANLEVLINNTPLTKTQREELIEGLKYLYDIASKHFIEEKKEDDSDK